MPLTIAEWFCLKEDRSSFRPRLPADKSFVFCHNEIIQNDILNSIQMRFATNDPIKMLIYGDWGVGKTHLMYHIQWWLEKNRNEYPAFPVLIEIGDITKKSRFDEIVRPFLDELGLDFLVKLVHDYRGKYANVHQALREAGVTAHVAEAFNKILLSSPGQAPVELVMLAFDYLKGRKVVGAGAGLGSPLDQSRDFVDVLTAIGEMYKTVHGHRMLFIADEAARLESVEADEAAQSHWVNANKLIFDDRNQSFGFVYTVSGKQRGELPRAIWEPQVQNRLGNNEFHLETLQIQDVEKYLVSLLAEFVDHEKVQRLLSAGEIARENYIAEKYPLTSESWAEFVDYFNRAQENAKPRDISQRLDEVAFLASKQRKRLIDTECLRQGNM